MPTYSNGYIPASALVSFGSGYDKDGRFYEWLLPPRTYVKHLALVDVGRQISGRTLRPSAGYSCYRPMHEQHYARQVHGIYAADPGKSSHGGDWSGPPTSWKLVDAAAIDYSNYIEVFGSEEAFFAACRSVGLVPQGIWPPAFPREAWHVIDMDNPYGPLPAGHNVTNFEEDDMFSEEDRNRQKNIENMLKHPGAAYGRPEVIQQRVDAIVEKLETGAGYDWLPAIANQGHAILAAVGGLNVTGAPVDVQALADALREGLGAEIASELAERLTNG